MFEILRLKLQLLHMILEFIYVKKSMGIDYQILVEADFLVNILEDGLSKEAALNVYHNVFKTECGKKICREMFGIC